MSLAETLAEIREHSKERIPEQARTLIGRAIAELRDAGLTAGAIKPGDRLPSFVLPDRHGEPVSSDALLADGSLVITLYRGVW